MGIVLPAGLKLSGVSASPDGRLLALGVEKTQPAQMLRWDRFLPPTATPATSQAGGGR
jgi:hypothetical protein